MTEDDPPGTRLDPVITLPSFLPSSGTDCPDSCSGFLSEGLLRIGGGEMEP